MNKHLLIIGGLAAGYLSSNAQTIKRDTIFYTGDEQKWAAPCGVSNVMIATYGAAGAAGSTINSTVNQGGLAGLGNKVVASWSNLTNLDTLYIYVGGKANQDQGGYNGGGNGIAINGQNPSGGGGGATDIRFPSNALNDRVQVSGGGGGGGNASIKANNSYSLGNASADGGNGGGNQLLYLNSLNGSDGATYADLDVTYPGAQGGTETSAGVKGNGCAGYLGLDGQMNNGPIGGSGGAGNNGFGYAKNYYAPSGGAGGGGYVGGNGGGGGSAGAVICTGNDFSAGGGGSAGTNYFDGVTDTIENGINNADGYVVITYTTQQAPVVTIDANFTTPCVGDSVMITASPVEGVWNTIPGPNAIQNNGMFVPSQQGEYELVFTAENCAGSSSDTITVDVNCSILSLEESSNNALNIFPNPATDFISIDNAFNATISVIDISGKKLITMNNYNGDKIAVASLAQGIYLIHVAKDNIITTKKFVKN